jgi:hypothetical protein
MEKDIGDLLNEWPFNPDEFSARRIKTQDGEDKIQIRIDMGILQLEVEGRPDGQRPYGHESLLDYYAATLEEQQRFGGQEEFSVDEDACEDLFQEAWQYYYRYLSLFHLEDYAGVERDTAHNLEIFALVQNYADNDEVKWYFEQYYPHAIMMQTRARGMQALDRQDYEGALKMVREGLERIESFAEEWEGEGEGEGGEDELPELVYLREWQEELENKRPLSDREQLERDLRIAVEAENFEEAARLRDKIQTMRPGYLGPNTGRPT